MFSILVCTCALGPGMDGRRALKGEGGPTQASVALPKVTGDTWGKVCLPLTL